MTIRSRLSELGTGRHIDHVARTTHAVLDGKGVTEPALRWAVFHGRVDEIPEKLLPFVEKVREHAYQITDEDVEMLKRAGYSEDAIFEVTASAALGAAILRLERGLIALNEAKQ